MVDPVFSFGHKGIDFLSSLFVNIFLFVPRNGPLPTTHPPPYTVFLSYQNSSSFHVSPDPGSLLHAELLNFLPYVMIIYLYFLVTDMCKATNRSTHSSSMVFRR